MIKNSVVSTMLATSQSDTVLPKQAAAAFLRPQYVHELLSEARFAAIHRQEFIKAPLIELGKKYQQTLSNGRYLTAMGFVAGLSITVVASPLSARFAAEHTGGSQLVASAAWALTGFLSFHIPFSLGYAALEHLFIKDPRYKHLKQESYVAKVAEVLIGISPVIEGSWIVTNLAMQQIATRLGGMSYENAVFSMQCISAVLFNLAIIPAIFSARKNGYGKTCLDAIKSCTMIVKRSAQVYGLGLADSIIAKVTFANAFKKNAGIEPAFFEK